MKKTKKVSFNPQPAYLLKLTLENVRCFGPQQTLDLSDKKGRPRQWTIILGDNGTGKSTLLQSISSLSPAINPIYFNNESIMEVALRIADLAEPPYYWTPNRTPNKNLKLEGDFIVGAKLSGKGKGNTVRIFADISVTGEGTLSSDEQLGFFLCCAYGASRRMAETQLSKDRLSDPIASLFLENARLINAEEWFLQADYLALKTSKDRDFIIKRRDKIKELLIKILPEIKDIKVGEISWKTQRPTVMFETPFGWVPIKELSLGYKTMIAWIVDLSRRLFETYPHSENPLAEPALVLIDEIDLHLHPKWQRKLFDYITDIFTNTQFIVTAHSPLIVQSVTNANIALLTRKDNYVLINNEIESVRGWRIDQVLTSDLFGLKSARPQYLDKLLEERVDLLSKGKLTDKDHKRLEQLDAEIGHLPAGSTIKEDKLMSILEEAAKYITKEKKSND